jgi:hypothetical protein
MPMDGPRLQPVIPVSFLQRKKFRTLTERQSTGTKSAALENLQQGGTSGKERDSKTD